KDSPHLISAPPTKKSTEADLNSSSNHNHQPPSSPFSPPVDIFGNPADSCKNFNGGPKNFAQQPTIVNDIRDCPIELPHYNGGVNHVGGDIGAAKLGGNFHHERVNKVDAYAIFQYKTRNYGLLSKEEICVLQHCMCELSKVSPQSALYDLELEVYTESNGGSNFGFLSGSGANRFVAVYNEYKDPEMIWARKTTRSRVSALPWRYLMYGFILLVFMGFAGAVVHYFAVPQTWLKTYVEGLVTVRSVVLDAKSDPYDKGQNPIFSEDFFSQHGLLP
ncbi:uncharacterized protein LOC134856037, partial [Symsagittifera roscoffensis]|uniref:uncharacterized protein LOC134856037 n=1 Tax=Symsagittifera roscoffensis TaxID=84072 RepID=UPI00307B5183